MFKRLNASFMQLFWARSGREFGSFTSYTQLFGVEIFGECLKICEIRRNFWQCLEFIMVQVLKIYEATLIGWMK